MFNLEAFQGNFKKKNHFEKWYFKVVNEKMQQVFVVSVDVHLEENERYSALHIMDTLNQKSYYITYDLRECVLSKKELMLQIGSNIFSKESISLDIHEEQFSIKGNLAFSEIKEVQNESFKQKILHVLKKNPLKKYSQKVISTRHEVMGEVFINENKLNFNSGTGYAEKTWGKTLPKTWIWSECHNFKNTTASLMLRIWRQSFIENYYTNFNLVIHIRGKAETFSNFTGARIIKLYRYRDYVHFIVNEKDTLIEVKVFGEGSGQLIVPNKTKINRMIYESLLGKMEVKVSEKGKVILEDTGYCTSLEIVGNTSRLIE